MLKELALALTVVALEIIPVLLSACLGAVAIYELFLKRD